MRLENITKNNYNFLTSILFFLSIVIAASAIVVAKKLDPHLIGPIFSLKHHFPEVLAFILFSLSLGLGCFWQDNMDMRDNIRVISSVYIVTFGVLAGTQTAGIFISGVPMLLFLLIAISHSLGLWIGISFDARGDLNARCG